MTTAYQTGPGLYGMFTTEGDKSVPPGVVRVLCVRLEAYDLPPSAEQHELETNFELIFAKAEGNPAIARALLSLGKSIEANRAQLEKLIV